MVFEGALKDKTHLSLLHLTTHYEKNLRHYFVVVILLLKHVCTHVNNVDIANYFIGKHVCRSVW